MYFLFEHSVQELGRCGMRTASFTDCDPLLLKTGGPFTQYTRPVRHILDNNGARRATYSVTWPVCHVTLCHVVW